MVLFNATAAEKRAHISIIPAEDSPKKTVIFDLGMVLFDVSSSKRISTLAPLFCWYPSLIYKACTSDMKQELFDMLNRVPANTSTTTGVMYNEGKQVPQVMVDWMNGRPNKDILHAIDTHVDQHEYTAAEKALFREISRLIFQADQLTDSMMPIQSMVNLAQALKAKGYRLYVLSNWDQESFPLMRQKHAQFFDIFDGIVISGEEKIGKPHPEFYQRLLTRYNIDPQKSVFIDDEKFNTDQAERIGITSVRKTSVDSVIAGLQKHRIVKESSHTSSEQAVHMAIAQKRKS